MMPLCRTSTIFYFLLLLGVGPLLFCWTDLNLIKRLASGLMNMKAPERFFMQDDFLDSKPWVNKVLMNTNDPREAVLSPWEEEQQRHLEIQDSRHRVLDEVCSKYQPELLGKVPTKNDLFLTFVEERHKLVYCEVPKVGCSNWKRVLLVLGNRADSVLSIAHREAHRNLTLLLKYNREGIIERLNKYTKVLFVRDPFERLVSAFRDKFENPNPYFHPTYGKLIIAKYRTNASKRALKTGDGVTFREFAQYLLDPQRPKGFDIHWKPITQLCHPCKLKFDFIGKFENMTGEANFLLRRIGAPAAVRYPDYKDRNPQENRTSFSITEKYFSQLNATERQGVYDLYRLDYLLFNYSKPLPDLI